MAHYDIELIFQGFFLGGVLTIFQKTVQKLTKHYVSWQTDNQSSFYRHNLRSKEVKKACHTEERPVSHILNTGKLMQIK